MAERLERWTFIPGPALFVLGRLDFFSVVPSSNPPDQACKIASWLASYHLGFLKPCYVPFKLFVSFSLKSLIRGEDN